MHEFRSVVYLDVQKTGSTFISQFLKDHLNEPEVRFAKHQRIRGDHDPAKLYLITARDPKQQYLSLYSAGCGKSGNFYKRLKAQNLDAFYDRTPQGFERWLAFVTDPVNAEHIKEGYPKTQPAVFGLQTFRFLALSLAKPLAVMKRMRDRETTVRLYRKLNIADVVLKTESLNDDLRALIQPGAPLADRLKDPAAALAQLDQGKKINTSRRVDREDDFTVSQGALRLIQDREWFMFEVLGYPRYLP